MLTKTQKDKYNVWDEAQQIAIPYFASEIPELGNRTPQAIIDEMGIIDETIKDLEKVKKILRSRLDSQRDGVKSLRGDKFSMEVTVSDREALDQAKAKAYFTLQGNLDEYTKVTKVETMRIRRL